MGPIKEEHPSKTREQVDKNTRNMEKIICKICRTYFSDWISLERHLENCYRRVCGVCGQTFTSSETLSEHEMTHEIPRTCKNVKIIQRKKLESHKCRFCKMSYKFPAEFRYHMMTHRTVKHYLCSYCGNNFSLSQRSKCKRTHSQHSHVHINKKTNNKASDSLKRQPRFGCSVCQKWYCWKKSLMKHKCNNTSNKIHKCSQCTKVFPSPFKLRQHVRIHTGEKPYVCSHCKKRFTQGSSLKTHLRIHSGEKPCVCSHCKKRFARLGDLNKHKLTHTGEKPHKCSHCSKSFSQISHLIRHKRTHSGEKPYQCTHCSKRFTESCSLNRHILTHTCMKP